ncbi:spore germination protein GerD [Jeotgalibacillus malaysiensis]|uniref:Spore germination protein GerD n=1 Tax=Jeotgalibacillus malaysiensis TaxID=1508404 RepID=A0A0B5AHF0_9BACL|nr:spore germination lipoprotein GerD [Jeotgalibacillus malaysiensis]AJD89506.1 spore germination protein GerD [Jeotgalibacillus malaysiensis]
MKKELLVSSALVLLLTGCAEEKTNYEETKQMVTDLLKTDDGKKAVKELLADEEIKKELVIDQPIVKESIQTTLLSKEGQDFWKKTFADPEFAETLAKSMKTEHEQLLKDLMKDPEYQNMILTIMQDPAMHEQTMSVLNSQAYKEETKKLMLEMMESPLVKKEMQDLLLDAAKEMGEEGAQQQGGGGEGGSGGDGGGDGNSESESGGGMGQ